MDASRIAELLRPFVDEQFPAEQLAPLQAYLDLLLRWNTRINLTAVRDPEQIVTRHFGESFFAARQLFPRASDIPSITLADLGSGAGFPGVPVKLYVPAINLTLIESQNKKAAFLRELLRALRVDGAQVFCGRAENWGNTADVVTLRAVEQFERTLPIAARLVGQGGRLCLLIGSSQLDAARKLAGETWTWLDPVAIPLSAGRVIAIAERN